MEKATFRPIQAQPINAERLRQPKSTIVAGNSFSHHLQQELEKTNKLTVSKHAQQRLLQRDIHISENRWLQIEEKVSEAKKLGVKDSLVLLDDAALIISAKNSTVITAMDRQEASSQIFTNINGTIVLE